MVGGRGWHRSLVLVVNSDVFSHNYTQLRTAIGVVLFFGGGGGGGGGQFFSVKLVEFGQKFTSNTFHFTLKDSLCII